MESESRLYIPILEKVQSRV